MRIIPVVGIDRVVDEGNPSDGRLRVVALRRASTRKRVSAQGVCLRFASWRSGMPNDTCTGVTWLITTSGVGSLARTRLPGCTINTPVRPEIGALIVAYWSWTVAFSMAARSAPTVASSAVAAVLVVSTCSRVAMPRSASSLERCAWAVALASCA